MPSGDQKLREQRRALPDAPGVYLFKDADGRALYVGKAKSIRKRVGSHFSSRASRTAEEFLSRVATIDFVATANEAEALLAEQNYIKRCQAPCVDYISEEEYRANIEAIVRFLSGQYRQIERELEGRMQQAAEAQEFEQAAVFRNRLRAVRSLFQRQRVSNEAVGTL